MYNELRTCELQIDFAALGLKDKIDFYHIVGAKQFILTDVSIALVISIFKII